MTEEERVWLVERTYSDKGLVTLVYATNDGTRYLQMQRSSTMLQSTEVTAGKRVDPARLRSVTDETDRERYVREANRMKNSHDPEDSV